MTNRLVSRLKFRHFSLIEAIAEHGTMSRAAEALGMTQSTASKMLGYIESVLGAALFEREARGMTLTPLGEYTREAVRVQLSQLDRFVRDFDSRKSGGYGTLSVGAIMGAAPDLVARAVAEIKAARPQLMVHLLGETSDHILDMLEAGRLDLAVGRFSTARHRRLFVFEPLRDEKLVLVGRSGHDLTRDFDGDLQTLTKWPWILQPETTPSRQVLDSAFLEADVPLPGNVIECVSIFAILNLVQVSDAVALLPASVVRDHVRAGLLEQLPMRPEISVGGFGVVTRRDTDLSAVATTFVQVLRKHAVEMGAPERA